jgi:hypothetical protein
MYFVTHDQVAKLEELGWTGDRNEFRRDDQDGFLAPRVEVNAALEAAGATFTGSPSGYDGIELLNIIEDGTAVAVESTSDKKTVKVKTGKLVVDAPEAEWDGRGRQKYVDIIKEEFEGIYNRVLITVPNGDPDEPKDTENELNIRIWSSPDPAAEIGGPELKTRPPEKLFGKKVLCQDYSFEPSKGSIQIKDPESDFVMMEYVKPNYLYFTWDAVEKDAVSSLHIFQECIKLFKEEIGVDNLKKEVSAIAQKRAEEERKRLIEFVRKAMDAEFKEARDRVKTLTDEIETHRKNLTNKLRERENKMILVDSPMCVDLEKRANKIIRDLYALNHVKNVIPVDQGIHVFTDEIRVTDPRTNRIHILGEFRIEISNRSDQDVRIFSETYKTGISAYNSGMQAPHVFPDGRPCLGDLVQSLPEAQARHDYSTVANLVILFLEHVNTDDAAGRHVHKWPRLEEDGSISEYKDRPSAEREVA